MDTKNQEIVSLLTEILNLLRKQDKPNRLWDAQDVGDYMGLSKASVQQRIICLPDFPDSIRIPTGTSARGSQTYTDPRWDQKDVILWINKFKGKHKTKGRPRKA